MAFCFLHLLGRPVEWLCIIQNNEVDRVEFFYPKSYTSTMVCVPTDRNLKGKDAIIGMLQTKPISRRFRRLPQMAERLCIINSN
jgi:hypothetical protein